MSTPLGKAMLAGFFVILGVGVAISIHNRSADSSNSSTSPSSDDLANSSHPPADYVLTTARSLALGEPWVHLTATVTTGGSTVDLVEFAGQQDGERTVIVGSSTGEIEQFGAEVYVRGDAAFLTTFQSMSTTRAVAAANTWILIRPGDEPYRRDLDGLTIPTIFDAGLISGPPSIGGDTTVGGLRAVAVTGTVGAGTNAGTATLFVAEDDPHLPYQYLRQQASSGGGFREQYNFDGWGDPPSSDLVRPRHATPYAHAGRRKA